MEIKCIDPHSAIRYHFTMQSETEGKTGAGPTPSRYRWEWRGVTFDFYRLCEILGVEHHAQAHALKKVIRAGRSIKPVEQDIDEAIAALSRWKEMLAEDAAAQAGRTISGV